MPVPPSKSKCIVTNFSFRRFPLKRSAPTLTCVWLIGWFITDQYLLDFSPMYDPLFSVLLLGMVPFLEPDDLPATLPLPIAPPLLASTTVSLLETTFPDHLSASGFLVVD